jgi:hypothetical protein
MAKTTKLINGDYEIIADNGSGTVTITGDLTVTGTQTTVNTTDTNITDNTIILNDGETGDGVTLGYAGLEVDRGTPDGSTLNDPATWRWNETDDVWEGKLGSAYSVVRGGSPDSVSPGNNDLVTVQYLAGLGIGAGTFSVDKIYEDDSKAEIQDFDTTGNPSKFFVEIDGTLVLEANATGLHVANVSINGNTISNSATDEDLTISTTGAGELLVNPVIALTEQTVDPTPTTTETRIYAKDPAGGGSGVFIANQNTTDELVTKSKAIVFSMIF